ncbi:YqaA family protein [Rhabdochlamydiaceae symbiont of Dictyostelium giganteum]|uniref:YqaA family protein n=1 Tax=Rhabdochlamydiaceae symbiont of Dictyostelium giganteum TaxID=3342349 RepID=UPI003850EA1F
MVGSSQKIYLWAAQKARHPLAPVWLSMVFLLELILFIPMDAILLLFCLENPSKRYLYALMATLSAVVTGAIGYGLGFMMWDVLKPYVLDHLVSSTFFYRITDYYQKIQHIAVFLGALLPVPYKAVTLSAGVSHLAFFPFLGAVCAARWIRSFLIIKAIEKWGDQIKEFMHRYFHHVILGISLKLAFILSCLWALS